MRTINSVLPDHQFRCHASQTKRVSGCTCGAKYGWENREDDHLMHVLDVVWAEGKRAGQYRAMQDRAAVLDEVEERINQSFDHAYDAEHFYNLDDYESEYSEGYRRRDGQVAKVLDLIREQANP